MKIIKRFYLRSVQCVRYHRSTSDLTGTDINFETASVESGESNSQFGLTSQSFFYNGKNLTSRGKTYDVNKPIQKDERENVPSYKGFDHYDDIALSDDDDVAKEDLSPTTVSTSASSIRRVPSLKPAPSFDLNDLGLVHPNPRQRFSWSSLLQKT